jgi:hypothetical protein
MFSRLPVWLILAALMAAMPLRGAEQNAWPFAVRQMRPDGTVESGEYLGPLLFRQTHAEGGEAEGFRPFWLHTREGPRESTLLLYPFFTWQRDDGYRSFSFFQLVNVSRDTGPDRPTDHRLDVWPVYFSRDTGEPADSYRALLPFGGTIRHRFGYDQIQFVLFPFYADTEKNAAHTTHAPWPFLRFIHGAGQHGFEFWPLFGHRGRAGDFDDQFYLWPLGYRSAKNLSAAQPEVKLGVLPFYTRDSAPGFISETFVWPFFGYTHRTEPYRYDEQRYLWPFLVQGRGDQRYVNRWGPVYTHSVIKGYDKTWFVWPLFRHARWADAGIAQEQNQVLWILYWSLTQRSTTNPAAAPAHKTHLWPLLSSWDNGAGQRQLQLLSPFEVFFPTNEPVRQLWSPLTAIYRYEQRAPGDTRGSVLFSLISWRNSPAGREFHLGPLGWSRPTATGPWKFSFFEFARNPASKATANPPP